jgi:hypothetical protein
MLFRRSRILSAAFLLVIASLAFGLAPAQASPGVAQTFGAANTAVGTTLSASPGATTGTGDLLVAVIKVRNTAALATVSGVSDSISNTWTKATGVAQGQADMEVWYTAGAAAVTSVTVTVSASSAIAFTVLVVTGALTSPLDQVATASATSTTPAAGPTGTTIQASELAVGAVGWNATPTPSGETAGYTLAPIQKSTATGSATGEESAYQILSATGAQAYGATLSSSVAWTAVVVTFKLGNPTPAPTITSLSPSSGTDGTAVTITGTHFTGVSAVNFNGTSASFTFVDDSHITTLVPAGATSGNVTVTTPGGTAASPTAFTVVPAIDASGISPTHGVIGATVTISGSGFTGATSVGFTGASQSVLTVNSDFQIITSVPSGAGTGTLTVTTPGGTSAPSAQTFSVDPSPTPTISGFLPASGPVGTSVTITGTGFTGASAVKFNSTAATVFSVTDDTHVNAIVPAGATNGLVSVTTLGGTATSSSSFTVTSGQALPHIMLIVMENKAYNSAAGTPYIIGSSSAPYINNTLVKNYTSATHWYANDHGSPKDYYDLVSGANQACCTKPYSATTIVDELNTANIPWKAYMESMPSNCYSGNPTVLYDPVHNPFAAFADYHSLCNGNNGVVPYNAPFSSSQLKTDLNSAAPPAFVFFTPNICNDMHTNGSPCGSNGVADGDTWLSTFIPAVQGTAWYANGGIIIITWDESVNADSSGGTFGTGGHIATLVISHNPKGAFTPSGDHFATLRGIEEEYGVPQLPLSSPNPISFGDLKPAF